MFVVIPFAGVQHSDFGRMSVIGVFTDSRLIIFASNEIYSTPTKQKITHTQKTQNRKNENK